MTGSPSVPADPVRLRIRSGDATIGATLLDNAATRSLVPQLPLSVRFSDYGGQEKTAPLPGPLSTAGMPGGDSARPLDLGYYAPGEVLVLYYADVGYFRGIARLGRLETTVEAVMAVPDGTDVVIELADPPRRVQLEDGEDTPARS